MKKTFIYILTVIMLILNLQITLTSAEDTVLNPEEAELLNALNLIDSEGFAEADYLTRAEFCALVCRLFNIETVSGGEVEFRDIEESHECFDAVAYLYGRGIIKGLSKYSFAPEREILAEEAATILVAALGFSELVKIDNASMLAKAKELGIFDGLSLASDEKITEETAKKLMYNTLFAPITKVSVSVDKITYSDDETLMMNEIYDLYEIKGVVNENGTASLFGEGTIRENQIKIDTEIYGKGTEIVDSLMGYSVYAYVMYDSDSEGTVIYARENEKKNNVYEFMSDELNSLDENYISFEIDKKEKKVKISNSIDAIYNGIGIKDFKNTLLNLKYGKIRLIDNTGDDKADVAIITEYKNLVVNNVVSTDTEFGIYDKYGNNIVADLVEENCVINVWKNGKAASITDVISGSAIVVTDSGKKERTRLIDIYLFKEKVDGVLAGIGNEEITLNGQSYKVSPYLDMESVTYYMSKDVTMYVDINGRASFITVENGEQYGFLYKGTWLEESEDLLLKVFTTDNEWKSYLLADKIRFNNIRKEDSDVYDDLLNGDIKVEQQVIRYEANDEGKITKLYTAQFKTKGDGSLDLEYDEELREKGMFRQSMLYKNRLFAHEVKGMYSKHGHGSWVEVFLSGSIPVLVRPMSEVTDEKQCHWYTQSYFQTDKSYYCDGYDLKEDNNISMMVVYQDLKYTVSSGDRFVVVDKIVSELNEEDEIVKKLYGYYGGTLTGFEAANDNAFKINGKEVKCGDVVMLAKDPYDKVDHIDDKLWFSVTSPNNYLTNYDDQNGVDTDMHNPVYPWRKKPVGRVSKLYGDYLKIEVQDSKHINLLLRSETKYVVYDGKARSGYELRVGTKNDIAVGDYIVGGVPWGKVQEIVIYKLD